MQTGVRLPCPSRTSPRSEGSRQLPRKVRTGRSRNKGRYFSGRTAPSAPLPPFFRTLHRMLPRASRLRRRPKQRMASARAGGRKRAMARPERITARKTAERLPRKLSGVYESLEDPLRPRQRQLQRKKTPGGLPPGRSSQAAARRRPVRNAVGSRTEPPEEAPAESPWAVRKP